MTTIPAVSSDNLEEMWRRFKVPLVNAYECRLKFVETLYADENDSCWKIEYQVPHGRCSLSDMISFKEFVFSSVGRFLPLEYRYNLSNRFYFFVRGGCELQLPKTSKKLTSRKRRDLRRSTEFKVKVAELESQAVALGSQKLAVPIAQKEKEYSAYIRSVNPEKMTRLGLGYKRFVNGGVLQPQAEPPVARSSARNFDIEQQLVQESVNNERKYVVGLFSDEKLVKKIRTYIAYLKDSKYQEVSASGESQLSCELCFKTFGLPIGLQLVELYEQVMHERGFSKDDIWKDLDTLQSYERSQRVIRLQSSREKFNSYYGINGQCKNSLSFNEYDYYHTVTHDGLNPRHKILEVYDHCGIIRRFA